MQRLGRDDGDWAEADQIADLGVGTICVLATSTWTMAVDPALPSTVLAVRHG